MLEVDYVTQIRDKGMITKAKVIDAIDMIVNDWMEEKFPRGIYICNHLNYLAEEAKISIEVKNWLKETVIKDVFALREIPETIFPFYNPAFNIEDARDWRDHRDIRFWYLNLLWLQIEDGTIELPKE